MTLTTKKAKLVFDEFIKAMFQNTYDRIIAKANLKNLNSSEIFVS